MAASNKPVFPQSGRTVSAVATAAKTTYNDSTGAVKLCDAGPNGSMLKGLYGIPRATLASTNQLMVFISPDDGVTMNLQDSALMAAHTVTATTRIPTTDFAKPTEETPIYAEPGDSFWVAMGVALTAGVVFNGRVEDL